MTNILLQCQVLIEPVPISLEGDELLVPLLVVGLLVDDPDDPEPEEEEPVSLTTPSAVVTEPELDDPLDPLELDPVLPESKESVPEIPPEFPVPASFRKVEASNWLFLLTCPSQAFQYTEAPYLAVLDWNVLLTMLPTPRCP